jgi:low affinity Fe/Cu permease
VAKTSWFSKTAKNVSRFTGGPLCFALAMGSVLVWAITGPFFGFSATWQMVINTGTTIITFLMVFLIQSSQNRDTEAIQIKLDELIRATHGAQNALMGLEELEPTELQKFRRSYTELASRAKDATDHEVSPAGIPHVELEGMPKHDAADDIGMSGRAEPARDASDGQSSA